MAGADSRRGRAPINFWPGWVDALATLLMVIMFLLMVFVVAQFYLREALTGREKTLKDLSGQIAEIAEMLNLERQNSARIAATPSESVVAKKAKASEVRTEFQYFGSSNTVRKLSIPTHSLSPPKGGSRVRAQ